MERIREVAIEILDEFEDFLQEKGIEIINRERDEYEADEGTEKAILFGSEYYALEDKIADILKKHGML